MNLRLPGQATLNSPRNFTKLILEDQTNKRLSELLPNETKLTHTYLPTYVPNKTAPNERGGEGRASL
jgi:hypothetical protein